MLLFKAKIKLCATMYRECKMNIRSTKKVVLELTSSCNLNCRHCFYRQNIDFQSSGFLNKKKVFDLIDKFKKNNIHNIVLTGGEPTLHPDFIEIAKYAKKNISRVTLCTNGVIKSKKLRDKIIKLNFNTYTLSIDSHINKIHDKFRGKRNALKSVINFTKYLKENKKKISIHITLHFDNIDHIEKTIEYCKKFNCEIVVSSIYYEKLTCNDKLKKIYYKKIEKFKNKYINNKDIILVGFSKYCNNRNCLDQKKVFTINRKGELVSCY